MYFKGMSKNIEDELLKENSNTKSKEDLVEELKNSVVYK